MLNEESLLECNNLCHSGLIHGQAVSQRSDKLLHDLGDELLASGPFEGL